MNWKVICIRIDLKEMTSDFGIDPADEGKD